MSEDDAVADAAGPSDVARFLVRTVLDAEFRELALRAPDDAFRGFDLSDADKDALRRGDVEMLRLLGDALRGDVVGTPAVTPVVPAAAAAPPVTRPVEAPPVPLPRISFQLNVEPFVLQTPEGLRVTCAVSMQPVQTPAPAPTAPPAPSAAAPVAWSAWDHDLGSERTRAAVAVVRAAGRGERLARILDLIATMTSSERRGGDDDAAVR